MRVKVWGARGSVPAPGPQMNRYGGNTSCVQVTPARAATTLILDAGTGIRTLGLDLRRRRADPHPAHPPAPRPHPGADVLPALLPGRVGDHDLGPVLARGLARGPDRPLHLGAALAGRGPRAALLGLLPRHARRASGRSAARRSAPRRSPTAGRRSATGSPTATRRSPTSPTTSRRSAAPLDGLEPEWISGFDLARDADLLIHDCQYTDEEYPEHVGWGHSAAHRHAHLRPPGRGASGCCSSTTTRCTPTSSSTTSAPRRAARWQRARRRRERSSRWRHGGRRARASATPRGCPGRSTPEQPGASTAGTSGRPASFDTRDKRPRRRARAYLGSRSVEPRPSALRGRRARRTWK